MPYSSVNYSRHVVHDFSSTYLAYNWKFVHFDNLHPIPHHPQNIIFKGRVVVYCLGGLNCFSIINNAIGEV